MTRTTITFYLTSYKVSITIEGDRPAAAAIVTNLFKNAKWGMIDHNGLMIRIDSIQWIDISDTEVVTSGLKPAGEADSI